MGILIFQINGKAFFKGEIITKMQNRVGHLKIFSRTTEPE
jgi:hypothetical protein